MEHNDGHIYTQHTLGFKAGDLLYASPLSPWPVQSRIKNEGFLKCKVTLYMRLFFS